MTLRSLSVVDFVVGCVVIAATATSAFMPAQPARVDVSGVWAFDIQTGQAAGSPTITIKQEGDALSGTYEGEYGPADIKGTLSGKDVRFSYDLQAQGRSVDVVHVGTVEGGSMKGSVSILAGQVTGTFTATRK